MSIDLRLESWLRLLLVPELKKPHWHRLHLAMGSPEAILGATAEQLCKSAQIGEDVARAILRGPDPDVLEQEKELLARSNADVYTFDDERYPQNLRRASAPPMMLYVHGQIHDDDRYAVVVVGSRTMTQYGKLACMRVVGDLVGAGVTVISGMAYGIDSVAHETTLRHGGRTLAVLAQGLAARETARRHELRKRIAERGAVISEFPMTAVAERYHFPTRNHTMAALGLATVVVEAAEKSGALITARKALDENRMVFAVPGDITRQTSRGTNGLIRNGAIPARDGQDVLFDLQPQLSAILGENGHEASSNAARVDLDGLSETARVVLDRVDQEPIHFDLLHEQLAEVGLDIGRLSAALLELEMKGLVRHLPGNLYTTERAL